MKFFWTVVVTILTLVTPLVQAESNLQALAHIPVCGQNCLVNSIMKSSCGLTNTTCVCTNEELTAQITLCVQEHCTIREQLEVLNYSMTSCGVEARHTRVTFWVPIIGGIITILFFLCRLIGRLPRFGGVFGWDDGLMCINMAFVITMMSISIELGSNGLGTDMWAVSADDITLVLEYFYHCEWLYVICLPLTKISILCFYLRIFPDKKFHKWCFVLMGLNGAYIITLLFTTIFQCSPVEGAWLHWDGTFEGTCLDININGWTSTALNICLDIGTIVLPLPELVKLNLSWRKKFGILSMFCVGFFATIVSILRLQCLIRYGNTTNVTWDYASVGYWSIIEVYASVICACMPGVAFFVKYFFPGVAAAASTAASKVSGKGSSAASNSFGSKNTNSHASKPSKSGLKDDRSFVQLVEMENGSSETMARTDDEHRH